MISDRFSQPRLHVATVLAIVFAGLLVTQATVSADEPLLTGASVLPVDRTKAEDGKVHDRESDSPTRKKKTPNVVLIMADDLGWKDLHCYGNDKLDTPNIDRLAEQGLFFTDAYSAAPVCTPTRAALMTGESPARLNITNHAGGHPPNFQKPGTDLVTPIWLRHLPLERVTLAEQLKKAQEGSQLEVVQAKVQQNEINLALRQAQVRFDATWREMAALAGNPNMMPVPLQGTLPNAETTLDWPSVASTMIASSPEVQAAQARINQARANICRQEVQPIPNLDVQLATGFDNGTDNGLINLQIGAPIPVFNKNQGNICAARAEYARASRELDRIQNSIKARLAAVSRAYDSSLVAVEQYTSDILPNAEEGLKLAELAYKAGETSFVQVLIARRTYFDTNLQYIVSQQQLAQARARVDGFVLTGALDAVVDNSGDDSLRGLTLSQQ